MNELLFIGGDMDLPDCRVDRYFWAFHPVRSMRVRTASKVHSFNLFAFKIDLRERDSLLSLAFEFDASVSFKDLFPIFRENLEEMRIRSLVRLIQTQDESEGFQFSIVPESNSVLINPFSVAHEMIVNHWLIENMSLLERLARLDNTAALRRPKRKVYVPQSFSRIVH